MSTPDTPPPPSPPAPRSGGWRLDVRAILALVAVSGLVLWSWRTVRETDPVRAAARHATYGSESDRLAAVETLGTAVAGEEEVALPALLQAADDPAAPVRAAALAGMGRLVVDVLGRRPAAVPTSGPAPALREASTVLKTLRRSLGDADPVVRQAAAAGLWQWVSLPASPGPTGPPPGFESVADAEVEGLLASLTARLADPQPEPRARALETLAALARRTNRPPPEALVKGLDDPDRSVRLAALRGLVSYRSGLDPLIPDLFRVAEADAVERDTAPLFDLAQLQVGRDAIPFVAKRLDTPNRQCRGVVAAVLGASGPDAATAAESLAAALARSLDEAKGGVGPLSTYDPVIQSARALGAVAPDAPVVGAKVLPLLTEAARSTAAPVREVAVRALGQLRSAAEPALPLLLELLEAESRPVIRTWLLSSLAEVADRTPSAARVRETIRRVGPTAGVPQAEVNRWVSQVHDP